MKKMLSVLLLLCFVFAEAHAEENETWIGEKKARELASIYFSEKSGLNEEEIKTYHFSEFSSKWLEDGTPAFIAIFFGDIDDPRYATNSYSVYINSHNGELIRITYPQAWHPVDLAYRHLEKERGALVDWTIEQKYELKLLSAAVYEEYLERPEEKNYLPLTRYAQQFMSYDYRLPNELCISEDTAKQLALDALQKTESFDAEYVQTQFRLSSSFLFSKQFVPEGRLVWKIFFLPLYDTRYYDYGYYAEIDAEDGTVLGIVHQLYTDNTSLVDHYE